MILVIGADGLIGGELHRVLRESGRSVLGTSRRADSEHLHLDLGRAEDFRIPEGLDVAVICAGIGSIAECAKAPETTSLVNIEGTLSIARRLMSEGSRILFLSTSLVFDGRAGPAQADAPLHPCCEYGRQKAVVEEAIAGELVACVRLTKVVETLRPRFSQWRSAIEAGQSISASSALHFSPVSLGETTHALANLAANFRPGTFHISGDEDFTYHRAAVCMAEALGLPVDAVEVDQNSGTEFFNPVPVSSALAPASPGESYGWRFSPSSSTLERFIRSF
jgi:dTDP-4-dehydrorhamnose reductase